MKKKWFSMIVIALLAAVMSVTGLTAFAEDGIPPDIADNSETTVGWEIISTQDNGVLFTFENGNIKHIAASDGVVDVQRMNMYAMRTSKRSADETYSVKATFTPDSDLASGSERTYGVIPWYLDENNFLIYWLQQKTDGAFSGQFYGKVNGSWKSRMYSDEETFWSNSEYDDFWWDGGNHPENIKGKKNILLTETITLLVNVSNVIHTGTQLPAKKFEIHEIGTKVVEGETVEDDGIIKTVWVKDSTLQGNIRTGVYMENFNMAIDNFNSYGITDDALVASAEEKIEAIASEVTKNDISDIITARNEYLELADNMNRVNPDSVDKLVLSETAAAIAVDAVISALDKTTISFLADVTEARTIFDSLSEEISSQVTKVALLMAAEVETSYLVAANAVINSINSIPEKVSLDDKDKVTAARTAYDALDANAKALISSAQLKKLTDAEAGIIELEKPDNNGKDDDKKKGCGIIFDVNSSGMFKGGLMIIGILILGILIIKRKHISQSN